MVSLDVLSENGIEGGALRHNVVWALPMAQRCSQTSQDRRCGEDGDLLAPPFFPVKRGEIMDFGQVLGYLGYLTSTSSLRLRDAVQGRRSSNSQTVDRSHGI